LTQEAWLKSLQRSFVTGLILLAPVAATVWVLKFIFDRMRQYSPFSFWGGELVTLLALLAFIVLVGWLSRTAMGGMLSLFGGALARIPVLGLVYSSVRDLVNAVSGEERRFRHPVWVRPLADSPVRLIGFITREDLSILGAHDEVAVYLPDSYNISGKLLVVPKVLVEPIRTESSDLFAFVATGGLSGANPKKKAP